MNTAVPFSELIGQIKAKFKIEKFEEKFEILYDRKEIPLTDGRSLIEIVDNIEKDEYPLFELREKFIKNMELKDKIIYFFRKCSFFYGFNFTNITEFFEQQKKEVDYKFNYWNNIYTVLFSSNLIGFSFISFILI